MRQAMGRDEHDLCGQTAYFELLQTSGQGMFFGLFEFDI